MGHDADDRADGLVDVSERSGVGALVGLVAVNQADSAHVADQEH